MNTVSVYQYQSASQFLKDWVSEKQRTDPTFSVRSCAKTADLSHTLFIFLYQNKRPLRARHGIALAQAMGLSSVERIYFQTLIELDNAKSIEQRELVSGWLRELHPGQMFTFKEVEEYKLFARWEHMAILAMLDLKKPPYSAEDAFQILGGAKNASTTLTEVSNAWDRLLNLGLMKQDNPMRAPLPTYTNISCKDDVANKGAREYHKQVMELSKNAVEAQKLEERELQSFTLTIRNQDLPKIKDTIRTFKAKLIKDFNIKMGNEIYQANLNFFRLTKNSIHKEQEK